MMRTYLLALAAAASLVLVGCNKSSPPPQKPVTPRGILHIEMPLQLPAP
jgi:predicted component of type VI protein secretion system